MSRLALVDAPTASLVDRMTLEDADREMRTPSLCYRTPEEIDADTERFLRDA